MEILETQKNLLICKDYASITFYSYNSKIAEYHVLNRTLVLTSLWNYSQTTLKQLKHFINTYTDFEYKDKKQFEELIKENLYTGIIIII
jgi:hypothetical protein